MRTAGLPALALAGPWPETQLQKIADEQLQLAFDAALPTLPDSPLRTAVYNARKHFFQRRKVPGPAFEQLLLHHPAIPAVNNLIDCLQHWRNTEEKSTLAGSATEVTLLQNWRTIQQAAEQPAFRQALLFASHDLLDRLPAFCARPPAQFTAKDRQTGLAVLQYLHRAAYKTSPFSRFTTVALWRWQQPPGQLDTEEPTFLQAPKAIVTPNVALLPMLYAVLLQDPAFYQSLRLTLNPTVEQTSGSALQWLYFDGERESFQQLADHPTVAAVVRLCLAHPGQISWSALMIQLQATVEGDEVDLQTFVFELIAWGLLAWEWPERGLSTGWCAGLYSYLGHLPATPAITGAAALLQWLRTAARTLPFQPIAEAQTTQRQTVQQVGAFFEQTGSTPPVTPEQIFFEDVEQSASIHVPPAAIRQLSQQLADCWRQSGPQRLPPFRSALFAFTAAELAVDESRAFLPFCRKFLAEKTTWEQKPPVEVQPWLGKIGALLQIFQEEDGQYGAVVNGLFPGGGKLLARWLHLLPLAVREELQTWFPTDALAYPWQDWSNANFQPPLGATTLVVPDGRTTGTPPGRSVLLGDLAVQRLVDGPRLIDRLTGRPIRLTDLGLESPTMRPPVMQVLWQLGVPFVSLEGLWPPHRHWKPVGEGWSYRPRLTYQSLVLLRATWRIAPTTWEKWLTVPDRSTGRLLIMHQALLQHGLPPHFFARFHSEKPQYFSRDSPAALLLLEKILRLGAGDLYCTEMLPTPEQAVVEQAGSRRAAEFMMEWEV